MSDVPQGFDPYAPPLEAEPVIEDSGRVPGALIAICIIAMILGGIGALRAVLGGVGLVVGQAVGQQMQDLFTPAQQPGMNQEMLDAQKEMQKKINEVTQRFLPFNIVREVFHFVTGVLLFLGGIVTIKRSARGRSVLMAACGLAVVYEIGQTALNAAMQMKIGPLMKDFMGEVMRNAPGPQNQAPPPDWLPQVMQAAVYIGLAFAVAVALVKIAFYLISLFYLQTSSARATAN